MALIPSHKTNANREAAAKMERLVGNEADLVRAYQAEVAQYASDLYAKLAQYATKDVAQHPAAAKFDAIVASQVSQAPESFDTDLDVEAIRQDIASSAE